MHIKILLVFVRKKNLCDHRNRAKHRHNMTVLLPLLPILDLISIRFQIVINMSNYMSRNINLFTLGMLTIS